MANPSTPARSHGVSDSVDQLFFQVYDQMRQVAATCLSAERPGHTLQPTALVHEAYLRIRGQRSLNVTRDAEFVRIAAKVMRRILIDHARGRNALKRGVGQQAHDLDLDGLVAVENDRFEVLFLDEALRELANHDPSKAQIVELRVFAGLTLTQVGEAIGMPRRTVDREWAFCRTWLRRRLTHPEGRAV